jgi:hypothetical protein
VGRGGWGWLAAACPPTAHRAALHCPPGLVADHPAAALPPLPRRHGMSMELQYVDLEERYRSRVLYAQAPEEQAGFAGELQEAQQVGGAAGAGWLGRARWRPGRAGWRLGWLGWLGRPFGCTSCGLQAALQLSGILKARPVAAPDSRPVLPRPSRRCGSSGRSCSRRRSEWTPSWRM